LRQHVSLNRKHPM